MFKKIDDLKKNEGYIFKLSFEKYGRFVYSLLAVNILLVILSILLLRTKQTDSFKYINVYMLSPLIVIPFIFAVQNRFKNKTLYFLYASVLIFITWIVMYQNRLSYNSLLIEILTCISFFSSAVLYYLVLILQKKKNSEKIKRREKEFVKKEQEYADVSLKKQELENQAYKIMMLYDSTKDIQRMTDFNDFISSIRSNLLKHFNFKYGRLVLYIPVEKEGSVKTEDIVIKTSVIKSLKDINDEIINLLKENRTLIFYSSRKSKLYSDKDECNGINDIFAPVINGRKLKGILHLSKIKEVFTNEEIDCLEIFVQQISLVFRKIELFNRVNHLTIHDSLTNLFVQKYYKKILDDEIKRAKNISRKFSIIMSDIDRFKQINDVYGHQAGDQILKKVAEVLSQEIRTVDFIARYGGDEFAFILPQTDLKGAEIVANRICSRLRNTYVGFHGKTLKVSLSMGVAEYDENITSSDQLIEKADKYLYQAKENGRDQVRS